MEELTKSQRKEFNQLMAKFRVENESINISFTDGGVESFHPTKKYFNIKSTNSIDLDIALKALPPNKENYKIGNGESQTNMVVYLKNPIPGNYSEHEFSINWMHQKTRVSITFPIKLIEAFVKRGFRGVYDSEYVYFTGISSVAIRKMEIPAYQFINSAGSIKWYGGNRSTQNKSLIEAIVNHLLNKS